MSYIYFVASIFEHVHMRKTIVLLNTEVFEQIVLEKKQGETFFLGFVIK